MRTRNIVLWTCDVGVPKYRSQRHRVTVYLAKPVNESQIFTIESSEDSVTMDDSWDDGANAVAADDLNIAQMNMPDDEEGEDQNLNL